jgi:hypothetical protein
MICQIKRDPDTNEIVEVLDPFGRKSKVFDKYVNYFSDTIDDPTIVKEEAAKLYLNSNNAESMVQNLANSDDFPVLEETINNFLELDNKELLLNLNKLYDNIIFDYEENLDEDDEYYGDEYSVLNVQESLNNLKNNFINLGYDVMDVQQLSDLYISSIVNEETDPGVFYYLLAAVTKDKQMQNFIYNNLPLYNNFQQLIESLNNLYKLPENINWNKKNYRNVEGKKTIFILDKEYNLVINNLDRNLIKSKLLPLFNSITYKGGSYENRKYNLVANLNGLVDNN